MPPDIGRASPARVYDYLLGGKDNFAADRDLAEAMMAAHPGLRVLAGANRAFILKAVTWAGAMLGISQFLDLGCGLPLRQAVHDAARAAQPDATVAYVDRDPVVISHVRALQSGPGLAAVQADVTDPATVLDAGELTGIIHWDGPACVILGGTLSSMDANTARETVTGYAEALMPGSAVIISCASYADKAFGERMARMFAPAGGWHNHSLEAVASFFAAGGLRLVHKRVMDVRCWPACPAEDDAPLPEACVLGGVGILD